jgi:hypothetical protein
MPFLVAYPRETQEMVFDAHDRSVNGGGKTRHGAAQLSTTPGILN